MGSESPTSVSVVIVTRNEQDRIRGCIESVLDLGDEIDLSDVILVDSNSSDGTVDVATEYPITVLRIPNDDLSTAGAGRQAGFQHATGDLVLFVDGDVHLADGWIEEAVRTVQRDPHVVGVDGHLADADPASPSNPTRPEERTEQGDSEDVDHLLAVALYDSAAFEQVGGFDPWLLSLEDVDLGYRLRRAGYRLVRLPVVVGSHPQGSGYREIWRRWKSGYMLGDGQWVRKSLDDPRMLLPWLSIYWFSLASGLWMTVGGLLAALGGRRLRRAWIALSAAAFGAGTVYRGPKWALEKLFSDLLMLAGVVIGFGRYDPDRGEFPFERVEIVETPTSNRV